MYCSIGCDTAISTLATKPGMAEYCKNDTRVNGLKLTPEETKVASGSEKGRPLFGYCQPCSQGCSPERIWDNFANRYTGPTGTLNDLQNCLQYCGDTCPRCLMDQLCINAWNKEIHNNLVPFPPEFIPQTTLSDATYNIYDTGTDTDGATVGWYAVPNTPYTAAVDAGETLPERWTIQTPEGSTSNTYAGHKTSYGAYPKAGCWYVDPSVTELQTDYMNCLAQPAILKGDVSPSDCA